MIVRIYITAALLAAVTLADSLIDLYYYEDMYCANTEPMDHSRYIGGTTADEFCRNPVLDCVPTLQGIGYKETCPASWSAPRGYQMTGKFRSNKYYSAPGCNPKDLQRVFVVKRDVCIKSGSSGRSFKRICDGRVAGLIDYSDDKCSGTGSGVNDQVTVGQCLEDTNGGSWFVSCDDALATIKEGSMVRNTGTRSSGSSGTTRSSTSSTESGSKNSPVSGSSVASSSGQTQNSKSESRVSPASSMDNHTNSTSTGHHNQAYSSSNLVTTVRLAMALWFTLLF